MRLLVLPESVTPAEGDADPDREDEPEGEAPAPPFSRTFRASRWSGGGDCGSPSLEGTADCKGLGQIRARAAETEGSNLTRYAR